jgi:hypothetical protein
MDMEANRPRTIPEDMARDFAVAASCDN